MPGQNKTAMERALEAAAAIERTRDELARWTAQRDEAIRELTAAGMKRRDVAGAAGVTFGRVQQIIERVRR